jgi:hypothetical protein
MTERGKKYALDDNISCGARGLEVSKDNDKGKRNGPRVFETNGTTSLRVAAGVARVARITRSITSTVRSSSAVTSVTVACCGGTLLEQRNPRFESFDLLSLHVFVHALSFQPARPSAFTSPWSFWLSGFERSNDKVVKLYQHIGRKKVDLELDLFGALQT